MTRQDIETLKRVESNIDVILDVLREEMSRINAEIAKVEAKQGEIK